MGYDEFADKLTKIRAEFRRLKGRELETVEELERYLSERLIKRRSRGLKSLKGLSL